ncbi:MAG: Exported protein of unknown function [Candidatus Midichloriaceae bacterium]|jgi:long-chain fatty acid transport protein|nr:Exported protein of unknown function [Candidatus Midichloriaceae bacterium]
MRKLIKASVFIASLSILNSANATNGYFMSGYGSKLGTSGAGVAKAMDATDGYSNPALLARAPSNFFVALGMFHPKRFKDTSATPPQSILGGAPAGNPIAGKQWSKSNNFPDGSIAVSWNKDKYSVGFSITGSGGMNTDYQNPRINPAVISSNSYDMGVNYRIINFTPALAMPIMNKQISIGIAPIISYSDFRSTSANSTFAETSGNNKTDRAWGVGARLGFDWKMTNELTFAAAGQIPTYYQRFDKYKDILKSSFNYPANATVGFAWDATKDTTLMLDYQYIHYKGTKLLKDNPQNGGFGWDNMNIFKVGIEHNFKDWLTARAGYSYGKSPISKEVVFANVIAPAVVEHHISGGLKYKTSKSKAVSLSGYYVPMKKMTDSGAGDLYSNFGKNTQIGMRQFGIQVSYQILF